MINDRALAPLEDVDGDTYTIQAGQEITIWSRGEFVRCLESTADIKISFNSGSKVIFGGGLSRNTRRGQIYENFQLYNDTLSDVTVTIVYGYGNVSDQRLSVTAPLNIASPSTLNTPPHVSVAGLSTGLLIAANSTRKEALLRNPLTNTHNFIVGDVNATSGRGFTLQPGEGIILTSTAAVYAYNAKSTAQLMEVMEV